jgi:hypothetical protein
VSSQTYPSVGEADDFEVWPFNDETNAVIRQTLVVHLEDGVGLAQPLTESKVYEE